jgi:hypothetical protein
MNTTNKTADFETNRFKEILKDANTALNIIDGEKVSNLGKIKLMPNQTLVLEINQ